MAEVRAFPGGRHDDQVDSMIQYLAWFDQRPTRDAWTRKLRF